jgi:RNA polymerase sigma-70 factor (ECF subfamily)
MPQMGGTDAELVARAQEGDVRAFDRLAARHRARLYGIARRAVGDAEAAQDIVQDALVRAFRSLDSLRDGERLGAWVSTIVRRESARWLADGRRRPEPVGDVLLIGGSGPVWQRAAELPDEVVERVRDSLRVLTERARRVMVLHYLEGYTCEEIARQVRLSAGGVKRILHDSRRKVRREVVEMAEAEKERRGPRGLIFWTSGDVPEGKWDVYAHLGPALAQAVCLSVNKLAKTAEHIAREVDAHTGYVSDTLRSLAELEVTVSPRKDQHLLNFIALGAEDWRRLVARVRQPAAEVAHRLAAAEGRLRAAFEQAPAAAAGWTWEDLIWVVYCLFTADRGVSRAMPTPESWPPPLRPGGFRYWSGGYEREPDTPHLATTSFCGGDRGRHGFAYFGTSASHEDHLWLFQPPYDGRRVLEALLDGPLTEEDLLARLEDGDVDWKSKLAEVVQAGLVERADREFRLMVPVFRAGDSEALVPEIDAVVAPIVEEVIVPTWADLDKLLDQMGYEHRRDQYPVWHHWLSANVMGESLRLLVEQGTLPKLGEEPPAKWNFVAWQGRVPMMSMGAG